jgi:predicted exporter
MRRYRASLLLVALLLIALLPLRGLHIDSDLSLFLPRAHDRDAALLVDELRDGGAARHLLLGIRAETDGALNSEQLAALSRAFRRAAESLPGIASLDNGELRDDPAQREWLMQHRYLLVHNTARDYTTSALRSELEARLAELASNSNLLAPQDLLRDPTQASLRALAAMLPATQPHKQHGVWMSEAGDRALLLASIDGNGYALDQQQALLDTLRARFDSLDSRGTLLEISGPAAFAVNARQTIESESRNLSIIASLAVMAVLFFAYRSPRILLLGALPVASGALAGVAAVALLFGGLHGITLTFGVTVLGVAMDYPIHLFSHLRGQARQAIGAIWPTLRLGLVTTALGYCALLFSDFPGLAQLGVFAIAGLFAAAGVTRWVLPEWLPDSAISAARKSPRPTQNWQRKSLLFAAVGLFALAAISPQDWLETDIAALSPIPASARQLDGELRAALGVADASHLLLVSGDSAEIVLRKQERLQILLTKARRAGLLEGWSAAANLLPSQATQRARQAMLPGEHGLHSVLLQATETLPLSAAKFAAFEADVAAARKAEPLEPFTAASTALDARLRPLLSQRDSEWIGRIALIGLQNPAELGQRIDNLALPSVDFIALRDTSSRLLDGFLNDALQQTLWLGLAIAASLLLAQRGRGLAISGAVLLALALDVALLHLLGEALSIFHIIGLLLVLGIGLDYALFRARGGDGRERADSAHALRTCWLSTLAVFGLLASSSLPVLHALGLTVAIGVSVSYLCAAVLVKPASG